jgi:hypothetical protein
MALIGYFCLTIHTLTELQFFNPQNQTKPTTNKENHMSTNNTGVPGKNSIVTRIASLADAWGDLAAEANFGEMTHAEFKTATAASLETRAQATSLKLQLRAVIGAQRAADQFSQDVCTRVVYAVKGSSSHGSDSTLYRAMGFIPKSERKSPTRKAAVPPPPSV